MIIVVKLKLFILTQFGGNRMLGVFWLTTDCNMKCIYCYEGNEKKKMYMNEETIDKAIEFLMTRAKELKDKRMNIEFHGGEPLLAYKSMESIVYKLRAKCDMEEIELRFGCTTNATLLNENRLAFISKEIDDFTISMDGAKWTQNYSRPLKSGGESFDDCVLDQCGVGCDIAGGDHPLDTSDVVGRARSV